MVTVRGIPYAAVREHPELLAEYADECSDYKPDPQWEMYAAMEQMGVLQALAVYVESVLAGFAGLVMAVNPHFGIKLATAESFFVGKQYRKVGAGTRLKAAMRETAKVNGCVRIYYHALAGSQLEELLGKRSTRTGSVFCEPL